MITIFSKTVSDKQETLALSKRGFTLIELLIVVAIIAILAAIAVPNFLEAQTRSKVSRVRADMRSLSTAIQSYGIDNNNKYPPDQNMAYFLNRLTPLTTPINYMTSAPSDPFIPRAVETIDPNNWGYEYFYTKGQWGRAVSAPSGFTLGNTAILVSFGPDRAVQGGEWIIFQPINPTLISIVYDPTNGTLSRGDIIRLVGETNGLREEF